MTRTGRENWVNAGSAPSTAVRQATSNHEAAQAQFRNVGAISLIVVRFAIGAAFRSAAAQRTTTAVLPRENCRSMIREKGTQDAIYADLAPRSSGPGCGEEID